MATIIGRFVPIVSWLPNYRRSWLAFDLTAGITIWGLLIPEMIAYASLAGLPPQAGLYTLLASLGLYAIFGTSRQLVVAGTSASAVLVFSTVTALKPTTATSYGTLAAGLIVLTGIIFVAAGLLRLGFITSFLSRPVMEGFVFGLAIFVTVSQLPKLLGLEKGSGDTVGQFFHVLTNLGSTSPVTFAVGAVSLVLLFGIERFIPHVPGGLVVLVLGIAISAGFGLSDHGVATVGTIPTGLPSVAWPHLKASDLWALISSAAGLMLVILSEALGAGQTFADKHGYRLDSNQEMIALGLANLGSGVLGGLACGGSLSQSAVNDGAGARSQVSLIVAASLSLVTVVALTPLFKDLPEAVLAALIIHAVSHLMKVGEMRRFYRLDSPRVLAWNVHARRRHRLRCPPRPGYRHRHRVAAAHLPGQPTPCLCAWSRPSNHGRVRGHRPPSGRRSDSRSAHCAPRRTALLRQRASRPGRSDRHGRLCAYSRESRGARHRQQRPSRYHRYRAPRRNWPTHSPPTAFPLPWPTSTTRLWP